MSIRHRARAGRRWFTTPGLAGLAMICGVTLTGMTVGQTAASTTNDSDRFLVAVQPADGFDPLALRDGHEACAALYEGATADRVEDYLVRAGAWDRETASRLVSAAGTYLCPETAAFVNDPLAREGMPDWVGPDELAVMSKVSR